VEVCFGKLWGTICHNSWDNRDAGVICKQLYNSSFGRLILTIYIYIYIYICVLLAIVLTVITALAVAGSLFAVVEIE